MTIPTLLPHHWAELQESCIAPDVAAANVASFGPGTERHWERERAELVAHARQAIQAESTTAKGFPQAQPGHLAPALIALDRRYRHLQAGGWRTLSAELEGLPRFDQWKPNAPRARADKPGRSIKYEAPPAFPDGGGLLLPQVPERCWALICERQGLPFPDAATRAAGFWAWAVATPELKLLICEGFKKALAAVSAGWAAVAVPGITMGYRGSPEAGYRLIEALQRLACPRRQWLIAFDAEAKPATAAKVGRASGTTAQLLRAAGGLVEIARLPLLPGTDKTGLDDLLAAAGPEALDRALADTGPRAVLPALTRADRIAPAGQWLGVACPIPSPEVAPLVVIRGPMGSGKTRAIADALTPLQAAGVPVLMPTHRKAVGRGSAAAVGVPWRPAPGSDERLQGIAACLDSWCPESSLAITGYSATGAVMVPDEWMQQLEHLLLSTGTTLAKESGRRASVLRTTAEQLARLRQGIFPDAQMAEWGVQLLERLTGRRAYVIASEHRPMLGRPLHCRQGLKTAEAAGDAFRAKWAQLLASEWESLFCWVSAQRGDVLIAPQRLAALHLERHPLDVVDVVDSTTPDLAAELANDPNGFIAGRLEQAQQQGGRYALYASPSISSGTSFERWRPDAVIAYAGGCIAPEHVAQALARVRCPEVPAWLFAPERATGAALRVGSGATNPAQLIADLRAVSDPLYGELEQAGADGAWLQAWAELGAVRNRQQHAYRATIAGLLEREGWELQAPAPEPCPAAGAQATADLKAAAEAFRLAALEAITEAPLLSPQAAAELRRRRRLEPNDRAALDRFQVASRWGLGDAPPSLELLEADRDKLRDRLKLGWLLTTPDAAGLVPEHDWQQIEALDPHGRPFAPDRLRVTLGARLGAFAALGVPALLQRFAAGEVIAADDPAVLALHTLATTHHRQLAAAANISPAKLPSGTLRALLQACGWQLERAGRRHGGGALTYRAAPIALPSGVEAEALQAVWRSELQARPEGALFAPTEKTHRGEKCSAPSQLPPSGPPPHGQRRPMGGFRALLRALAPPPRRARALAAA